MVDPRFLVVERFIECQLSYESVKESISDIDCSSDSFRPLSQG